MRMGPKRNSTCRRMHWLQLREGGNGTRQFARKTGVAQSRTPGLRGRIWVEGLEAYSALVLLPEQILKFDAARARQGSRSHSQPPMRLEAQVRLLVLAQLGWR